MLGCCRINRKEERVKVMVNNQLVTFLHQLQPSTTAGKMGTTEASEGTELVEQMK